MAEEINTVTVGAQGEPITDLKTLVPGKKYLINDYSIGTNRTVDTPPNMIGEYESEIIEADIIMFINILFI